MTEKQLEDIASGTGELTKLEQRALADMVIGLVAAMRSAAIGDGAYSRDQLTHAGNCIENMKLILNTALAAYDKSMLKGTP